MGQDLQVTALGALEGLRKALCRGLGPPRCGTVVLTSPRSAAGSPSQGAPSPHACDGPEATPAESCAPREQLREELASAQAQWPGRHCAFRGELQVLGRPSRLGGGASCGPVRGLPPSCRSPDVAGVTVCAARSPSRAGCGRAAWMSWRRAPGLSGATARQQLLGRGP